MRPRKPFAVLGAALAALVGLAGPAATQVPLIPVPPAASAASSLPDPDGTLVEELVVVARERGPAWWRVSNGQSTVYVLGVPTVTPKGLAWDRSGLERRLQGANLVILPFSNVGVGVLGAPGALFNLMRLRSRSPIEDHLNGDLRVRFVAARTRIGQPANRYGTRNALAAGLILAQDYRDHAKLTAADPGKTIGRLAKAQRVKVEAKTYDVGPIMGAAIRTPQAAQSACLDDVLQEIEAGPGAADRAAHAWADGDVPNALGGERSYERCMASAAGAGALDAKLKADQAAAIAHALKTPGHAIAVVQLRPLLSQGGVLDRLRAQGFEVKTPGDE
jgi:uncharacterized protein YbaP (TraB family)